METQSNNISSTLVSSSMLITITTATTTTTVENMLNTTEVKHRGILNQLFLQTIGCQIVSGFFAWAALCITIHHVSIKEFVIMRFKTVYDRY